MSDSGVIGINSLEKNFAGRPVLRGIDLTIAPGDLTVLIGASGCGKSTLLRCLNGLEIFDGGEVRINGFVLKRERCAPERDRAYHAMAQQVRRRVGMVFQSFNLFPHLTLLQNVMKAPMVVQKMPRDAAESAARALLEKVGLTEHADHYPVQLSGGQQQRGAIARALAMSPEVMLYDEPTSALDPTLTDEVWQVMRKLDQEGMTQIVVTHEYRSARELADRVIFLDEGRVVEDDVPEKIFTAPREERTRRFLRHML